MLRLDATWADLAAQAIFHTLVASLFLEALVRSWRVRDPGQRMALRLLALGYPLLVFPLLAFAVPLRGGDAFKEWALFVGRRWDEVTFARISLFRAWVVGLGALGSALLLMDLVPLVRGRRRPRPAASRPDAATAAALDAALAPVAARLGLTPAPPLVYLDRDVPVLFCTGVRRHAVVVSRGALALLDPQELRAALAHELAHLARHDPAASWVLMAARVLMFFNPAYQVVARAVAHDAEDLADERAAVLSGERLALASGLLKLWRATSGSASSVRRTLPFAAALAEPLARVRALEIEKRCRRLLDPAPRPLPFAAARLALAGLSLTGLLFFVV